MQLHNCTEVLRNDDSDSNFAAYYLVFPASATFLTEPVQTTLQGISKEHAKATFLQVNQASEEERRGYVGKQLGEEIAKKFLSSVSIQENDTLFLAYGDRKECVSDFLSGISSVPTRFAFF